MQQREAIILDVEGRTAVVLAADGSFRRIPAPPGARAGQRVRLPAHGVSRPRALVLAVAAAVLLAVLLPAGFLPVRSAEAVALVSLDLGGTVELAVDGRGRVVAVAAADPELAAVAARLEGLRGRPLVEVVAAAAEAAAAAGLVQPERPLVLAAVPVRDDPAVQARLRQQVEEVRREAGKRAGKGGKARTVAAAVLDRRAREAAQARGLGLAEAIARVAERQRVDAEAVLRAVEEGGVEPLLAALAQLEEPDGRDEGQGGEEVPQRRGPGSERSPAPRDGGRGGKGKGEGRDRAGRDEVPAGEERPGGAVGSPADGGPGGSPAWVPRPVPGLVPGPGGEDGGGEAGDDGSPPRGRGEGRGRGGEEEGGGKGKRDDRGR